MCKYNGLTLYMGILKLPKLRDCWCVKSIFHVPYPQKVMSRDLFLSITWNMHLNDPAEDAANDRKKRFLFVLCDSSGYTVHFNIYTGKSNVVIGKGLSFDDVMSLVRKEFLGSGYHIYCDNFYTSPVLFQHLHNLGFGACGAIRDTRIGVPQTKVNALTRESPRGSIRWIRQGSLLFTKLMDTREVSVCTTLHTWGTL